ncbi:polysaccharide biosynthesis/export family protein [Ramlibacter sp.]|uniref:polysaccharide biosynthesis/export family protein n=1 Tax=Ramlibacter sp. TaxID=1917967 RepID=UPI00179233C8|nr:polysaccharide biosynthesis/export family protein [Ramlibacter sp.]MBA2672798.1 polysaccharide biosynthesis/export family protein [Ramlibacter sp.]
MSSLRLKAWVAAAAAVLLPALCPAQGTGGPALGVAVSQPLDPRPGAARTGDAELAAARSAAASAQLLTIGKDYRISANDLIEIDLPDIDALKRTLRVNAAGLVSLPLVGSVQIAGLTSEGAERRIAERYQEKYLQNPQVAVFIKEFTAERITMEGAVVKPGIYPVTGQLTLLRALALAGGFGPIANSSEVMLFRVDETTKKREMLTFDVEKIRTGKSEDPPVKGDDLIVVQRDSTRRLLKDSIIRDVFDTFNPFSILAR